MGTLVEVVYPSTSAFSGTAQLDLGPYFVPSVKRLLRVELHGQINSQGTTFGATSVGSNFELYAVQWVPHGAGPSDCVTTADGAQWLIRRQLNKPGYNITWDATSATANSINGSGLDGSWAGQLAINSDIDLYLSLRAPTGASVGNFNLYASLRFWWS